MAICNKIILSPTDLNKIVVDGNNITLQCDIVLPPGWVPPVGRKLIGGSNTKGKVGGSNSKRSVGGSNVKRSVGGSNSKRNLTNLN